jgi:hypothetical protein
MQAEGQSTGARLGLKPSDSLALSRHPGCTVREQMLRATPVARGAGSGNVLIFSGMRVRMGLVSAGGRAGCGEDRIGSVHGQGEVW